MKKTLLLFLLVSILFSCKKQENYTIPTNPTTFTSRSGDEDHDEDHDEDEGICCQIRYGKWDTCVNGIQIRSWTANSKQCQPPLDSIQRSCASAIVQYFYYTSYGLRIVCNIDGRVNIYNSTDQITASLSYNSGGRWINISFLPPGTYTATTYGLTVRFTR
jgi:hypothetical protein